MKLVEHGYGKDAIFWSETNVSPVGVVVSESDPFGVGIGSVYGVANRFFEGHFYGFGWFAEENGVVVADVGGFHAIGMG